MLSNFELTKSIIAAEPIVQALVGTYTKPQTAVGRFQLKFLSAGQNTDCEQNEYKCNFFHKMSAKIF